VQVVEASSSISPSKTLVANKFTRPNNFFVGSGSTSPAWSPSSSSAGSSIAAATSAGRFQKPEIAIAQVPVWDDSPVWDDDIDDSSFAGLARKVTAHCDDDDDDDDDISELHPSVPIREIDLKVADNADVDVDVDVESELLDWLTEEKKVMIKYPSQLFTITKHLVQVPLHSNPMRSCI
jgi:hypothetical protein